VTGTVALGGGVRVGSAVSVPAMAVSIRSSREIVASGVQAETKKTKTSKIFSLNKKVPLHINCMLIEKRSVPV
jgi:hypothetical protein